MMNIPSEQLPSYHRFTSSITSLSLPHSGSELHGLMCGYLCAGASHEGLAYLRTLTTSKSSDQVSSAKMILFSVYFVSEQQINNFDFEFKLMLPDDSVPLIARAEAFSEWCRGFIKGLKISGIVANQFDDEDAEDAFKHLEEFAELDYSDIKVCEEDEIALMEVSEYTRMAVLRLYSDLFEGSFKNDKSEVAH